LPSRSIPEETLAMRAGENLFKYYTFLASRYGTETAPASLYGEAVLSQNAALL
jgi:hypothetical protein